MKKALITGITGQDGAYLAELLLEKGYQVHGIIRRASIFNTQRIDPLYRDPHDPEVQPSEVYNLAAQSHVKVSFEQPEYTADVVATGTLRLLDAVRDYCQNDRELVRVYQAGSSEMFGGALPPQSEATSFEPRSPYAVSKVAGYWFARNYREAYGMFIANGILFNHESPLRGETFVTRKITRAVGRIKLGLQNKLYLGNLDAKRDWGFAGDYVEAMWKMLQHEVPDDFVVATGEAHSVREFLEASFEHAGLEWENHVEIDERYFRPTEVDHLLGDASKATQKLKWQPKISFKQLVAMMVDNDMVQAERERLLVDAGHSVGQLGSLNG